MNELAAIILCFLIPMSLLIGCLNIIIGLTSFIALCIILIICIFIER